MIYWEFSLRIYSHQSGWFPHRNQVSPQKHQIKIQLLCTRREFGNIYSGFSTSQKKFVQLVRLARQCRSGRTNLLVLPLRICRRGIWTEKSSSPLPSRNVQEQKTNFFSNSGQLVPTTRFHRLHLWYLRTQFPKRIFQTESRWNVFKYIRSTTQCTSNIVERQSTTQTSIWFPIILAVGDKSDRESFCACWCFFLNFGLIPLRLSFMRQNVSNESSKQRLD